MRDEQDSTPNCDRTDFTRADTSPRRRELARITCALALCACSTVATACEYEAFGDTDDPTLGDFRDDDDPLGDCPTGETDGCDGEDTDVPRMHSDPDAELDEYWIGDPETASGEA